jgi:chromate transporter
MKRRFVDDLHWLDEQEMVDYAALAQSSPGAIAVNAAILVGWRVAGLPGMLVSILGTILPPMVILAVISFFYNIFVSNRIVAMVLRGMQAGAAAVILDVACDLGKKSAREHGGIMILAFLVIFFTDINVIFVLLAAAGIGVVMNLLQKRGNTES